MLGSVAPAPHHIPLLSSHTPFVGAICVQVVVLYWQGPLIAPLACELVPISRVVRFADARMSRIDKIRKHRLRVDRP